jgi:hypothetical protein
VSSPRRIIAPGVLIVAVVTLVYFRVDFAWCDVNLGQSLDQNIVRVIFLFLVFKLERRVDI